ncbi:MAG: threonine synthase [Synergistaceae bacterium]|jgi:threonine synthase|nr:threonine synthase [Synergistaceae bacterium]
MKVGILKRYGAYLPISEKTPEVNLEEGSTPLVRLDRIGNELGIELWAKLEGCNPSGSFKDRGMVLAVAKALEDGAKALVCASTGNTSASAAAYAAHAGIPCYVLLPSGKVALGKLAQALIYGAKVISVNGNFDRALELARKASEVKGFAMVNSVNPYRIISQKTGAWEICESLGRAPDLHVIPVGNAGNISAYWAGYKDFQSRGRIKNLPKMLGIQAEGAAPLATGKPCPNPETIATAIRIGNPVSAETAKTAVAESGGLFDSVTDDEILRAQKTLASRAGIFAEPASCTTLAGLFKLALAKKLPQGAKTAIVLTGNGLKDPDTAISQAASPVKIGDTLEELLEALSR